MTSSKALVSDEFMGHRISLQRKRGVTMATTKTTETSVTIKTKLSELISTTDLCEALKQFTDVGDDAKITFEFNSQRRFDHYNIDLADVMNLDVTATVVHRVKEGS